MVDVLSHQRLLPRLTRLLEAFRAIRSARLADDNHLGTNVITDTLQTTDEALRTLAITATNGHIYRFHYTSWHTRHKHCSYKIITTVSHRVREESREYS